MDINFPLILVIATFATGLVWLLDSLLFAPRRRLVEAEASASVGSGASVDASPAAAEEAALPPLVEYSKSFFPVLAIVLVLRSFLIEPFQIPSGSMLPTLQVGDFILVNKFAYGVRLPVAHTKVLDVGSPERGDVMVFRNPEDGRTNYIKRVVGIPGDTVTYRNRVLYINDEPVSETLLRTLNAGGQRFHEYMERLGEAEHRIYENKRALDARQGSWEVPEGQYFVLGDNRDNSRDSRYLGFIPEHNIVGKAFAIWMHWESLTSLPTFSRVGGID